MPDTVPKKPIPPNYRRLAGSELVSAPGARLVGPADPNEILSVSIYVRPTGCAAAAG